MKELTIGWTNRLTDKWFGWFSIVYFVVQIIYATLFCGLVKYSWAIWNNNLPNLHAFAFRV